MSETATKQTSGLAIAGLVLGILAAVTSFLPIINNLSAIIAVIGGVLAAIALVGAIRGKHTAKGLSIAGVVLAVLSFAVVLATQSAYKKAFDKAVSGPEPVASASSQSEASSATQDAEPEQAEQPAEPAKDFSNMAVGETVTFDDGLSVTVNSVQTGLTNYDDSLITCINVTYTNNGSSSASFSSYDWKGEDANGAQRNTAYYSEETEPLSSGKLSKGGTVTGNIYFDDGITRVMYYSNMFNDDASAGWKL